MKFASDILAKAGLTVDGVVTFNNTATGQTPASNDNSTKLATTAWVRTYVSTASVLGGIKIGNGLSIDASGVVSVTGGGLTGTASIRTENAQTATAGQTVFTIPGGYTPGLIDVFINGSHLTGSNFTATNGTTVTLADAAAVGDIVDFVVYSGIYSGSMVTTDQLAEGTTNLYFTTARACGAISGTAGRISYTSSTGVIDLATSGATAGSYGSSSAIPTITVDAYGRITSVSTTAVSIITTLAGLSDVTLTSPSANQLIRYNSSTSKWENFSPTYISGISSSDVTTALGFTPYNATNPSGYVSSNLYTADGTLTGNRAVTLGSNSISFTATRTSGTAFSVASTQTAANSTDLVDTAMKLDFTLSGSGAATQLVNRVFYLVANHNRTSTTLSNMRVFNMQANTASGTTTTNLDVLYIENGGSTAGTVTNSKAIIVVSMQGTNQASFVVSGLSGTNNTHLLLGTNVIPTGNWSMYSATSTYNNYFAGKVLIGTNTVGTYNLDVNGTARIQTDATVTGNLFMGVTTSSYRVTVQSANNDVTSSSIYLNNTNAGTAAASYLTLGASGASSWIGNYSSVHSNPAWAGRMVIGMTSSGNGITLSASGGASQDIRFAVQAGEVLRMTSTQNVLIGTVTDVTTSILTLNSSTKGFLPPRMTQAQREAISSPATGLVVYQTDGTEGLYIKLASGWKGLVVA